MFSHDGYLSIRFSYQTRTDDEGRTLFSFMTPDGLENPTLHVHPGDHLIVTITNNTQATPVEMPAPPPTCGGSVMTHSSVNIHFHGTNVSPTCGQDEVVHTIINSGETFQYNLAFPLDEPPGVYWYHPHAHGLTEAALHLHQTHFLVLSQENFALNGTEPDRTAVGQYLDTIQVPYWDGNPDHPYPKVTVRVDFRGPDIGDFVYHCHIAEHEDAGMMAIIRVLPFPGNVTPNRAASISE